MTGVLNRSSTSKLQSSPFGVVHQIGMVSQTSFQSDTSIVMISLWSGCARSPGLDSSSLSFFFLLLFFSLFL